MTWNIDSGMFYDAGKKCHLLADDISLALGPLNATLQNECGGMAGDHEKCSSWTTTYDRHAADIVTLTATLANALRRYGDVLEACGYNWWHSNRAKASGSEPARPTASEPLYDSGMALPVTSKGDNGAGLDEGAVVGLLEKVGKIPNGDATKLAAARDAWKKFAESEYITGAESRIRGVGAKFEGSTDPNIIDIDEKLNTLEQAAKLVAEAAKGMVTPVSDHHAALTDMRSEIQSAVAQAGVEIAAAIGITIAVVAVTAVFTAGLASGGAAAGGAVITVEIVEGTALIIKNTVTASRLLVIFGAVVAAGTATGGFTGIPDLTNAGVSAALTAIAGLAVYVAADDSSDTGSTGSGSESTPTDRIKEHLTDRDLDAARRELNGEVVARKPDGTPWDHVQEVRDAQQGLANRIDQINRRLGWPGLDAAERAALERELSEASKLLDHSEQFVPRN
ncbi:polymorphic toxin type 28 domain-containing protein [Nocardia neocaledoniensis]|uniref:polymorphic toxin type 28 domain-containing protein n=1 Tax=Nocardia neocaledoniensis TaxID=236511 RepID=UPI002456DE10|nr:polymorphic toxin type 28 domain-containing protein [Nocardia neocaledoniensis]